MKLGKILTLVLTLATANISAVEGYKFENDPLEKLKKVHFGILRLKEKAGDLEREPSIELFKEIFDGVDGLEKIKLRDNIIFVNTDHKKQIDDDLSAISEIAKKVRDVRKKHEEFDLCNKVIDFNNQFFGISNDLHSIKLGFYQGTAYKTIVDEERILLGIQSLFNSLKTKDNFKPNCLGRLFAYDPEMIALRKTLSVVTSNEEFNQNFLAEIFEVSPPTVSKFLRGANSKKLLESFYEKTTYKNINVSEQTMNMGNLATFSSSNFLIPKNTKPKKNLVF
jgi:hypothetical protein